MSLATVVALAILAGGGGSHYGLANLAVLLGALLTLSFHRHAFAKLVTETPLLLTILIVASLLVPIAQIVPLPHEIWSAAPGRELVERSYGLAGLERERWAALSVHPARTLMALLALIVPVTVLAIGWTVSRDRLILVGWVVVVLGLVQLLLGIVQVLSNGETGLVYPENPMPGVLFGLFANRNSTGLFLVGTLCLAMLLPPPAGMTRGAAFVRTGIVTLLVLAVLLTRSRTALVLALLPMALGALRIWQARRAAPEDPHAAPPRTRMIAVVLTGLALVAAGLTFASAPGRVGDTIERFDAERVDGRFYIWDDASFSAERYWPVGSGIGTFDDVFQIDESLENMATRRAGRAHNDYLEVAIEGGAAALALVVAWLAALAWLAWRARAARGRWIAWSGGAILLVIALQSITDYPLRNLSMLGLAGFALLLLVKFGGSSASRRAGS